MARNNQTLNRVFALVEPVCNGAGYELVDLRFVLEQGGWTLRVCIDLLQADEEHRVDSGDCERASREISAVLDVEDPIPQAYNLEVSSPGIDRPLRTPAHFAKYVGSEIKAAMATPLMQDGNERRNFRGIIEGVDGGLLRLKVDNKTYNLVIDDIDTARIIPDWDAVLRGDTSVAAKPAKPVDPRPGKSKKADKAAKAKHKSPTNNSGSDSGSGSADA
jgi:ribosome maturation factor RimP